MWSAILCLVAGLAVIFISVTLRARRIEVAWRVNARGAPEPSSPLGEAIKDFVAVAGGTYLGLTALMDFLKVEIPQRVTLWGGVALDPLALVAIVLALITPFFPVPHAR